MTRLSRLNTDLAPLFPPALAPMGLLMAGTDAETMRTSSFMGVAVGWLVLAGLAPLWRQRIRRAGGGQRPGLGFALWLFAGLTAMLLVAKMLWGLEHAGGLFAEGRDVVGRGLQAVVFYAAAAIVSLRPVAPEEGREKPGSSA